jgi:hypothetical protein
MLLLFTDIYGLRERRVHTALEAIFLPQAMFLQGASRRVNNITVDRSLSAKAQ